VLNLKSALTALLGATLSSCATTHQDLAPRVPSGHNFSYLVPLREDVNLIQAFDDGSTTYLQFKEMPPSTIEVRRLPDNDAVSYTVEDHYVKVAGVYEALRVTVADHSTSVINQASEPSRAAAATSSPAANSEINPTQREGTPMSAMNAVKIISELERRALPDESMTTPRLRLQPAPVGVPESLQTMHANLKVTSLKREISTLEERVRLLTAALDEAHRAGSGASVFLRDMGRSPRVVLTFDDNSFNAHVDEGLLETLSAAARAANRIYLHGHTDAYVASESGTELAIRRAVEVRKL
jgi:hypothetical protein